jgi:hypothetical protein
LNSEIRPLMHNFLESCTKTMGRSVWLMTTVWPRWQGQVSMEASNSREEGLQKRWILRLRQMASGGSKDPL